MDNFVIDTNDIGKLEEPVKDGGIPPCDAYFLVYLNGDDLRFETWAKNECYSDLATMISVIREDSFMEEVIERLPDLLPDGDQIAEELIDRISYAEEFSNDLEESAIIQPAELFNNQGHNHD